jgi:regulatory protein
MDRKVTALKIQKRNPKRINVYLDGEYAFGLARIVAAWLKVGMIINDEKILQLQSQDTEEMAMQKALRYLSYRPRSITELTRKLRTHGFNEGVIDNIIQRLCNDGLLGDEQFASLWVDNRMTFRPRSKRMLTSELKQKGVAEDMIQKALEGVEDESAAYQLSLRFMRKNEKIEWPIYRKKLSTYLARRGFNYETIKSVVRGVWLEFHETEGEIT